MAKYYENCPVKHVSVVIDAEYEFSNGTNKFSSFHCDYELLNGCEFKDKCPVVENIPKIFITKWYD